MLYTVGPLPCPLAPLCGFSLPNSRKVRVRESLQKSSTPPISLPYWEATDQKTNAAVLLLAANEERQSKPPTHSKPRSHPYPPFRYSTHTHTFCKSHTSSFASWCVNVLCKQRHVPLHCSITCVHSEIFPNGATRRGIEHVVLSVLFSLLPCCSWQIALRTSLKSEPRLHLVRGFALPPELSYEREREIV